MTRLRNMALLALFLTLFTAACAPTSEPTPLRTGTIRPITARNLQVVSGQKLYVPAYSSVFFGGINSSLKLTVTLTIHNTDESNPIFVQSVRFYDTDGNFVRQYIEETLEVPPLATVGFVVESTDNTGGWGSNFIVEWVAEQPVYEPIVEAIMVSSGGNQGISFISPGRIMSEIDAVPPN